MIDPAHDTLWLHDRIARLREGDRVAADELLRAVGIRLDALAHRMLGNYPGIRTGADTGDVVQGALVRLMNALRDVRPTSTRDFVGLAALQLRRELLDLARHFAARGAGRASPTPRPQISARAVAMPRPTSNSGRGSTPRSTACPPKSGKRSG